MQLSISASVIAGLMMHGLSSGCGLVPSLDIGFDAGTGFGAVWRGSGGDEGWRGALTAFSGLDAGVEVGAGAAEAGAGLAGEGGVTSGGTVEGATDAPEAVAAGLIAAVAVAGAPAVMPRASENGNSRSTMPAEITASTFDTGP